jgi:uncharacterized protein with FMN-binding domain
MHSRVTFLLVAAALSAGIFLVSQAIDPTAAGPFTREAFAAPGDFQKGRQWNVKGDGFRRNGDWVKAKRCYEEALKSFQAGNAQRFIPPVQAMIDLCDLMPTLNLSRMTDGAYQGVQRGYVDDVTVEVTVKGGRITAFRVVSQRESRALKSLETVTQQITARKTPSVDAFSGATITSYAVMGATAQALKQAQPAPKNDAGKTAPK